MRSKYNVGAFVCMLFAAAEPDSALSGELYWTAIQPVNYSKVYVYTMSLDGSGLKEILPAHGESIFGFPLELDYVRNELYFLEYIAPPPREEFFVRRASLDGSQSERIIVSGLPSSRIDGMALAPQRNVLFLVMGADQQDRQSIYSVDLSNLQATRIVQLPEGADSIFNLNVDDRRGLLYWQSFDRLWRSDFNGEDQRMILDVRGVTGVSDYDIDVVTGDLFLNLGQNLNRMNNRGEQRTFLFHAENSYGGLALEPAERKLYWVRGDSHSLERINLDGSNREIVAYLAGQPSDLALVPTPYQILLGDLDGSGLLNNLDIEPFVLALFSQAAYRQRYPNVDYQYQGDLNLDGYFDNLDVAPFAAMLAGTTSAVPEPAADMLAIAGCLGLLLLGALKKRRRLRMSLCGRSLQSMVESVRHGRARKRG